MYKSSFTGSVFIKYQRENLSYLSHFNNKEKKKGLNYEMT